MKTTLLTISVLTATVAGIQSQVFLQENFSYSDGRLATVSGDLWLNHSGTTALNVSSGAASIVQPDTTGGREDVNRLLSTTFIPDNNANNSDNSLFSSFSVTFSALPNGTVGSYFAHFKTSTANQFYGRVGANTANAAAGSFRLAISNGGWSSTAATQFPLDLALGETYSVVTSLNLDTRVATLWVNPADQNSVSVSATDSFTFSGTLIAYALRQGTTGSSPVPIEGPGSLLLDNLIVGRSFADVTPVPEPHEYAFAAGLGLLAFAAYRRRKPAAC